MAFFSENLKFSTVDSILTKIMVYFEDKTNRKKKTAALLLYTQLKHVQEQHHLLQLFGLFIIMLSFKQRSCFLSSRAVPTAVFDKRVFYLHLLNSRTVLCQFHAKDRLKYNQTVTEKFEECCKVTDNTVMVVIFTVDVNNEIIQMKYNVPSQKGPCLHVKEIGSRSISRLQYKYRHRVFYGLEFLSGVMDWSIGVEPWVELTGAIFFPRPLPGFGGISNFIL